MAITLNCSCGKILKVDEKHRGKKAKCPECGNTLVVEEQEQETAVSEKPKKRVAVADDDDDRGGTAVKSGKPSKRADPDDDDDDDAPPARKPIKKKAAKSNMMMYLIGGGCGGLLLLTCCSGIIGGAVWYFMFGSSAEDLKYIHEGNIGFVSIRIADGWKNATIREQMKNMPGNADMDKKIKEWEDKGGMKVDDIERVTMIFRSFGDMMNPDFGMVMKTSRAMDRKKVVEATAKEANVKEKEVKHDGHTLYVFPKNGPDNLVLCFVSDRVVLMGPKEDTIKAMLSPNAKPAKNPALTRGIDMARSGKHLIVAAFEVKKDLVDKMGGGAGAGFGLNVDNLLKLNGVIVAAGIVAKDVTGEAILTYENKDVAGKAKGEIDNMLGALKAKKAPPAVTKIMNSLKVEQSGADVSIKITANIDELKGLMNPFGMGGFGDAGGGGGPIAGGPGGVGDPIGGVPVGGGGFKEAADRTKTTNNLKQIALAMHNFHDAKKSLPNHAIRHPQTGFPLLSWRVTLLPYLDQEPLYKQIRLNEPWDSPHNRQFWNQMPAIYRSPNVPGDGRSTFYQVFHGNETAFPKSNKPANVTMAGGIPLTQILDGTSNTIMVAESATPINWMRPDDIPFEMNDPGLINRVGNHWSNNTFLVAMCDGSVRAVRRSVTLQNLRGAITRAGGEISNID